MKKLTTEDMLSLEEYDKSREEIKSNLMSHKKNRSIKIGDNVLLLFEDYQTIKYQVQEMLRIEKPCLKICAYRYLNLKELRHQFQKLKSSGDLLNH